MRSSEKNEFWSALLEKAYAKLNGSYEHLNSGTTSEAFQDFTGAITKTYFLNKVTSNLFKIMLKAYNSYSMMGCCIEADPDPQVPEAVTPKGLIKGHAYSITKVQFVDVKTPKSSAKIPLIRLRNPWGDETE
ncbi:hypothetical protein PVAND_013695 [Polypedilum vanderplanki]|uniref:Calpain catalytic domain-containing protein n=1 Tax=Polypedilum vanderplanki TaxID=319348 RepID=A0A9J6CR22_POLVA|nr:hypothetical protein PVAND_013695 [Polypedilum vanderplanki]